jgi:MFS family permease
VSAETVTATSSPAHAVGRSSSRRRAWLGLWGAVLVCSWGGNQFSPLLLMYENRDHYSALTVNAFLGVYVLGLAPALLVSGSLSDRHGRRPVMLAGLAAALVGSALLALGPLGAGFLAAGRLLSGVTVGVAMSVGNAWIKELSEAPYDSAARGAGARRASLAFTVGSGGGAVVAGLLAQWGPLPEVLPFLLHIAVSLPFLLVVARLPETQRGGGLPGPWWRQLAIPSAGHRRFLRVVAVAAPWIFAAAGIGYGYLPTALRGATGAWGLVFATAATAVALGTSSLMQPIAKRLHSVDSARGLASAALVIVVGIATVAVAVWQQSVWIGLAANLVLGVGIGIALVSGLLEVQAIAGPRDLAGLTGVFYAIAYIGFLTPAVIAALAAVVPVLLILAVVVAIGLASWLAILAASRKHLPAR